MLVLAAIFCIFQIQFKCILQITTKYMAKLIFKHWRYKYEKKHYGVK